MGVIRNMMEFSLDFVLSLLARMELGEVGVEEEQEEPQAAEES